MANIAFTGSTTNYSFSIAGRRILIAPEDTAMPTVEPITDANLPAGWVDLGPTENQEVTLNLSRQTENIEVGVIPTTKRKYITSQEGSLEATLLRYEPETIGYNAGVAAEALVAGAAPARDYIDIYLGGTLGAIQSILVFEDFDTPLVEDAAAGNTFDQVWHYTPKAQADGDIDLSRRVTRAPAVALRLTLLGFDVAGVTRTVLLHQRWISDSSTG